MRHRGWTPERWLPALLGAVLGFHPIVEADTFWHLTLGRAVLRYGSRSVPEPTAFKAWTEPCVAIEWLWDVFTLGVLQLGGETLLSLLPAVFGALLGYLVGLAIGRRAQAGSVLLNCVLGVIVVCASADLLNVRPNLVFLVLLVAWVELCERYAQTGEPLGLGIGSCALAHVWAQLHASFVLALPIFGITLAPHARTILQRRAWSPALIALGLLLTVFTCPSGPRVLGLVLAHSDGDAVKHIVDMQPFDWTTLGLFGWPLGAALCVSLFLIGWAALSGERLAWAPVLLGVLGAALTFTARRFATPWVLLLLPLTASALRALSLRCAGTPRLRSIELTAVLIALCMVVWTYRRTDGLYGPMLHSGVRVGAFPVEAARYLQRMPAGTPVLTEYLGGGPLGYWLDGHVRTFVDGRTPMYFDATDWATAREVLIGHEALELAIARYGLRAAVVDRESMLCPELAARWKAVVVEARHTTFVPAAADSSEALTGLAPCGRFYLSEDACRDGARSLTHAIDRLGALHASRFVSFLRAAAALQCQTAPLANALTWLPEQSAARMYMPMYRWYASWAKLAAGQGDAALALIEAGLADDDPLAVRVLLQPEAAELPIAQLRAALERGLIEMDDNAPAALRARLALICVAQHDAECARFQGLRAYLRGSREAIPALLWAAEQHASARVRADLRAWLATKR